MKAPSQVCKENILEARFAIAVAVTFFCVNLFFALRHVMWRDEWMPLVSAQFTGSYSEFFEVVRYIGRIGFFTFCWSLVKIGGGYLPFKLAIVLISTIGVYLLCRYSPLSRLQKCLFAFGYYPLYEYGTILRDYSIIFALSIACCVILCSSKWRPLLFSVVVALLFQTNPFGLALGCALALTFVFDAWRRGLLMVATFKQPRLWVGAAIVMASFVAALVTMIPPPDVAVIVLGQSLRTDSHLIRLGESLAFPLRAWLPVPLFASWNSHILDPWPWLQVLLSLGGAVLIASVVAPSRTALFLFLSGMFGLGMLLCHLPWTALRYHGPYFVLALLSYWVFLREASRGQLRPSWPGWPGWLRANSGMGLTAVLTVHVVVAAIFLMQEQVIPFSGSREAARIIREHGGPDAVVVGDPDYPMISLTGYLGKEIYIASRGELGSFTKVDLKRRAVPLSPEELAQAVGQVVSRSKRDVILVTTYQLAVPPEVGRLLGVARGSTDETYMIYNIFAAAAGAP
jgi:hypothetical protein